MWNRAERVVMFGLWVMMMGIYLEGGIVVALLFFSYLVYAQTDGVIFWFLCWYIIFHFFFLCDGIVKFLDAQRLLFQVIFGWRYLYTIDVLVLENFKSALRL